MAPNTGLPERWATIAEGSLPEFFLLSPHEAYRAEGDRQSQDPDLPGTSGDSTESARSSAHTGSNREVSDEQEKILSFLFS